MSWSYTRALNSCDDDDYKIEDGTTHVVWVVGRGPLFDIAGKV